MANVNIKFNGKDYLLSCDDGQEENLKKLANHLDSKYSELKKDLGNIGENKLLLIAAIQMVDDYFDILQKVQNTKNDFFPVTYEIIYALAWKNLPKKIMKNKIWTSSNMLSIRYPWTLWGLGNVSKTFLAMFPRPLLGPSRNLKSPGQPATRQGCGYREVKNRPRNFQKFQIFKFQINI